MRLRIVLIAPLRFPIRRPFAGGLESAVWNELRLLRSRGHDVQLVATAGSDFLEGGPSRFTLPAVDWRDDPAAADDTYPDGYLDRALPALDRALDLVRERSDEIDVVVNHCLHGLPLERAGTLGVPMVSTLHTPVVEDLVSSNAVAIGRRSRFLSVSRHTARTWASAGVESDVLHNGVDASTWVEGPGGSDLVWFGRIVPEKGPHLALEAARLMGRSLVLAGRVGDRRYFESEILPRLDARRTFAGPLDTDQLATLVGQSVCALTTPLWDEPFGLVTPEALLTGTPVAGFAVGGVSELAERSVGLITVPVGDVAALAGAAEELIARSRDESGFRGAIRASAVTRFSLDNRVTALEAVLREVAAPRDSTGLPVEEPAA